MNIKAPSPTSQRRARNSIYLLNPHEDELFAAGADRKQRQKPGNTQENIQPRWREEFMTPQPPAREGRGSRQTDPGGIPLFTLDGAPSRRYLSGMKREEWVAPMPGRPCFTGL